MSVQNKGRVFLQEQKQNQDLELGGNGQVITQINKGG